MEMSELTWGRPAGLGEPAGLAEQGHLSLVSGDDELWAS